MASKNIGKNAFLGRALNPKEKANVSELRFSLHEACLSGEINEPCGFMIFTFHISLHEKYPE